MTPEHEDILNSYLALDQSEWLDLWLDEMIESCKERIVNKARQLAESEGNMQTVREIIKIEGERIGYERVKAKIENGRITAAEGRK